jgi:hemin transport system permease protein
MFLALREIRRAKARFGLLMAAVALLMFLILTQQALQSGLITAFVGAIQRQSAPVLVYAVDGQRTLQGSVITPPLEKAVSGVPGVAGTGRIGQGTFTVSVNGGDQSDAALIGYAKPKLGGPDRLSAGRMPRAAGEAVGSAADFALGDRVAVVGGAGGPRLRVVGLAEDAQIQVTPTLFVSWSDYVAARRAVNPDAGTVLPSVIGVRPAAGVSAADLASRINRASPQADALTREQAAAETPGVADVQRSFDVIFLLFALVVPLVTGLFFLIITLQKARALTLLRAIGAPAGVLVRALLVQVLIIIGGGVVVGTLLYAPLSQATVGSLSLRFDLRAVVLWGALLLVLGLASAVAAARRVLAIDPVEATTGGGAR